VQLLVDAVQEGPRSIRYVPLRSPLSTEYTRYCPDPETTTFPIRPSRAPHRTPSRERLS
jgi:hypothetical protein